uniref:Uncharacterized protein n=1 Tax=Solanum tuberosum TaxID=4113 RepID=M1CUP7_SOLTU
MNVLVCLRDWIISERRNKGKTQNTGEEEEELEEIMSIEDPSAQASPNYRLVDFENYEPIHVNVNTYELEKMIRNR